jgi:hypothetical protein
MIEHDTWCPDVVTPVASAAPALQEVAVGADSRLARWRQRVNITPGRTGRPDRAGDDGGDRRRRAAHRGGISADLITFAETTMGPPLPAGEHGFACGINAMDTGWYASNSDCAIRPRRGL